MNLPLQLHPSVASPGDTVTLQMGGEAPYTVTFACFVDDPPPAGFRECEACRTHKINEHRWSFKVEDWWHGMDGKLSIEVQDTKGKHGTAKLQVEGVQGKVEKFMTAD
jgi:hypothetical protein